jgi:hypothetical protein
MALKNKRPIEVGQNFLKNIGAVSTLEEERANPSQTSLYYPSVAPIK